VTSPLQDCLALLLLLVVITIMILLWLQTGLLCGLWGAACVIVSINTSSTCSCLLPSITTPYISSNISSSSSSSSSSHHTLISLLTIPQLHATL
jgi:hypothetical protein